MKLPTKQQISYNRVCICGHGGVVHKRGPCSRCECQQFEETVVRRVGDAYVTVLKSEMKKKEEG